MFMLRQRPSSRHARRIVCSLPVESPMKRFVLLNIVLACITFAVTARAADKKIEQLFGSTCLVGK